MLGVLVVPIVLRNPRLSGAGVRAGRIALVALVALAAVLPWTVRNLTTFERPVLFSDNVDSVFAGANCKRTYSGRSIGAWDSYCYAAVFRHGWDESVAFSEARHAGTLYLRHHLDRLPVVVAARLGREFGVFKPFEGIGNDGRDPWLWIASATSFWLMAALGVAGAVMLHRARRLMWPLAAVAGFATVAGRRHVRRARLRAPLDIALLVVAAVPIERGLARLFGWGDDGPVRPLDDQVGAPAATAGEAAATRAAFAPRRVRRSR